jgi:hypothetical protein
MTGSNKFTVAIILGASLIISALVFGLFFYNSRTVDNTIRVVGTATDRFESDIVKWRLSISRDTGMTGMKAGYDLINQDMEAFRAALTERGFKPEDITVQPVNTMPYYSDGKQVGYTMMQSVFIISKDIDAIEELALNPGKITDRDIVFQYSNLEYYYSELSEMKLSLLSAATKDARRRADEIASGTGDEIGAIQSARTGVFQITEPYSTEVSDYGIYNVGSRTKDITVTVTVVYTIK